jgi:hypothetical protein
VSDDRDNAALALPLGLTETSPEVLAPHGFEHFLEWSPPCDVKGSCGILFLVVGMTERGGRGLFFDAGNRPDAHHLGET